MVELIEKLIYGFRDLFISYENIIFTVLTLFWLILTFTRFSLALLIVSILLLIFAFPLVYHFLFSLIAGVPFSEILPQYYISVVIFLLGLFGVKKSLWG